MTGLKLAHKVERLFAGRNMPWLVFCPQYQPEQTEGWWTLTAWHERSRAPLRLHKSMLEDEKRLVEAVLEQLPLTSPKKAKA